VTTVKTIIVEMIVIIDGSSSNTNDEGKQGTPAAPMHESL
jgi:hypothetical protein